ncbi:hypothetical protein ACHHYP_00162 [Achlya hypogyna]|uniref:A to I editase domain-containing protein n=1 Tax=Achlya hypogyna TaxID=1202772 RepID=A0A1V9ZBB4_ACHHY|nr:hypothetical protein ACHHYP_00162 [Achlya hypogyna]
MATPDDVAAAALAWFHAKIPAKKHASNEHTVLAAIVVEREGSLDVLSVGSGTKCLGQSSLCADGYLIHDAHAEIMCRRAFLRYLYLAAFFIDEAPTIFEHSTNGKLALLASCKLHLYVSEAPCGDAALYNMKADVLEDIHEQKLKRRKLDSDLVTTVPCRTTGAKEVTSTRHSNVRGVARVKSGRTDIPEANRTVSMSCSDKICKWLSCGLQGSLLSQWFAPIHLSSVVVSVDTKSDAASFRDTVTQSLQRGGATNVAVATTTAAFPLTRSLEATTRTSASGLSLNWTLIPKEWTGPAPLDTKPDVEYLVGARGLKMGTKKVVDLKTKQKMCSRLARRKLFAAASQLESAPVERTYAAAKQQQTEYKASQRAFLTLPSFQAWKGAPAAMKSFTLACDSDRTDTQTSA